MGDPRMLISAMAMPQTHTRIVGRGDYVFDSGWNDEAFVQIATGDRHTVALRADGSVVAWGANAFGSIYDGTCDVPAFCLPDSCTWRSRLD